VTHHTIGSFFRALGQRPFWVAGLNIFLRFRRPLDVLIRYVFGRGTYPARFTVRTPIGEEVVTAYSYHDLLTLVECFGKLDYRVPRDISGVVDVGANIGISALYFLTRNPHVRVRLYEPVAENAKRLRRNLEGFEERYELLERAVGTENGTVTFAVEPTGRYGGIVTERYLEKHGLDDARTVEVPAVEINQVVRAARDAWGTVDLLKLDVEWSEADLIRSLHPESLRAVRRIYVEGDFPDEVPGFRRSRYGAIIRFEGKDSLGVKTGPSLPRRGEG
jgi:FkbM family methyltransferase